MKKTVVVLFLVAALFLALPTVGAQNIDVWEKAKENGIQFRAVGNEPGWLIEIREDEKVRFVNDYGNLEVKAPIDDVWHGQLERIKFII